MGNGGSKLYRSLKNGIDAYIHMLPEDQHSKAWQELPYLVQFGPTLLKWWKHIPLMSWVNPGIEYGGLTEYDKTAIDQKIPSRFRIKTLEFPSATKLSYDLITTHPDYKALEYPLVIKPVYGERGNGIWFLESQQALAEHFKKLAAGERVEQESYIQEYCGYQQEYCIQFYKYYGKNKELIVESGGVSLRDMPIVIGNGHDTVLSLIDKKSLGDRYKNNITTRLEKNQPSLLTSVPESGKKITIVRTASIDFGTVYKTITLTAEQSTALIKLIEALTAGFGPEYISGGRFDIKAPSLDSLLEGTCKVIECNAGGGIPTIVYDESLTVFEKYTLLDRHFEKLITIARINRQNAKIETKEHHLYGWAEFFPVIMHSFKKKGLSFSKGNKQYREIISLYNTITAIMISQRRKKITKKIQQFFSI